MEIVNQETLIVSQGIMEDISIQMEQLTQHILEIDEWQDIKVS